MKKHFLKIYRLLILLGTGCALFWYHSSTAARGNFPLSLKEVHAHIPTAERLSFGSESIKVFNKKGALLATALRTAPIANDIKGYAGSTDALILIDSAQNIIGVSLRSSQDTPGHTEDVKGDYVFMDSWKGRSLNIVSQVKDLEAHEIWGVSGATKTSNCMSEGIIYRSAVYLNRASAPGFTFKVENLIFIIVLLLSGVGTFTKVKNSPKYRQLLRLIIFLIVVVKGVDLLCLSILDGWMSNGPPLRSAPVLLCYITLLFLIPAISRKQIYCQQLCPHGYIQDQLLKWVPAKYHLKLSKDTRWVLGFLPFLLIISALVISIFGLPWDQADLEVFAAWYPARASWVCIGLFIVSVVFSAVVPKGYCKYACPTGRLLEYSRSKGRADKFSTGDKAAGALLILTLLTVIILSLMQESA